MKKTLLAYSMLLLSTLMMAQGNKTNDFVPSERFAYSYGFLSGEQWHSLELEATEQLFKQCFDGFWADINKENSQDARQEFNAVLFKMTQAKANKAEDGSQKKLTADELNSFAYNYGIILATNLKGLGIKAEHVAKKRFEEGFRQSAVGQKGELSQSAARSEVTATFQLVQAEQAEAQKAKNDAFLKKNKHKKGMIALASGIQYEVLQAGTGAQPVDLSSQVTTHYHGTLLDGTVFDSSVDRGQPISFALNGVIKGWQEVLLLMKEGGKVRAYIPADLAYGNRARGKIPANSLLIFDIELISVNN